MAKRHTLVDSSCTPVPKRVCTTNWDLCVFCQKNTKAALECPVRSSKPPIGIGYVHVSLANQLIQFDSHGQLPFEIDIERLDDGEGIEATLMKHCACWHKTCRLKFNQTKLDRLNKKEKHESIPTMSQGVQTRSSTDAIDAKNEICFFCGEPPEPDEPFHHVSTYDLDKKIRQCALELEDTALLAKLAPGDLIALEAKYHHKCLAALYNRVRSAQSHAVEDSNAKLHGIAFAVKIVINLLKLTSDVSTGVCEQFVNNGVVNNYDLEFLPLRLLIT